MKRILVSFCGLLGVASLAQASIIADWTFETSAPVTAGPFSPEIGAGSISGSHAGVAAYSSPAGNGSAHSFSANNWAVGDYWQIQVNTVGQSSVFLTWDQTSSNTGPGFGKLQVSTDGSTFTDFVASYAILANAAPNPAWNATTSSSIYTFSYDVSSVAANQATMYFRLVDTSTVSANAGTVAAAGTDRIDNVMVTTTAVPEPAGVSVLGGFCLLAWNFVRRRK
jgi:hypothetical protein